MAGNNLRVAKKEKNDEFYTQLCDIEKELRHYKEHFKDKIVFCNCDDPEWSNFWKYFSLNFEHLGLKKLISTHYEDDKPSYKLEIIKDENGDGKIDGKDVIKTELKQNGDFRSPESIEILKECDIVVTNPPFSLFREYIALLEEHNKKYLIIGNYNSITYQDIFKLVKENKLWVGVSPRSMKFKLPDGTLKGVNACWFTNLEHSKRNNEEIILWKSYYENKIDYPKYDNYDAIEVSKVNEIPIDYDGYIGIPITFLEKYNPNQFEIIGQGQGNLYRELSENGLSNNFVQDYYISGQTGSIKENHPVLGYYDKNNKPIIPYMRIIIKKKEIKQ